MLDDRNSVGLFRKTALVYALELHEDVTIDTPEGTMEAHAGDFLVSDDPPTRLWPVQRAVVRADLRAGVMTPRLVLLVVAATGLHEYCIP